MFRNSTITDLFLFVFTQHIVYYPLQNIDINILFYFIQKITTNDHMTKQKINQIVGSIGAFIGIIVFIAYIPQIFANLQGNKAQPFQPLSAAVSCLIWVLYGWTKEPKKDWILIIPNSAGVILGGLTFLTSL